MTNPYFSASITGNLKQILDDEEKALANIARDAVECAATTLRDRLRGQVRAAGLGRGLEKAWRLKIYPRARQRTLRPTAFVFSKARKLHNAYNTGGTISARNGSKFLAIPSQYVQRKFYPRRQMTPSEVEEQFNQDLFFVPYKSGRPGGVLVLNDVVRSNNGRGLRRATKRRLASGRKAESVIMFYLIPSARFDKKLDIDGPSSVAEADMYNIFMDGLNG